MRHLFHAAMSEHRQGSGRLHGCELQVKAVATKQGATCRHHRHESCRVLARHPFSAVGDVAAVVTSSLLDPPNPPRPTLGCPTPARTVVPLPALDSPPPGVGNSLLPFGASESIRESLKSRPSAVAPTRPRRQVCQCVGGIIHTVFLLAPAWCWGSGLVARSYRIAPSPPPSP